MRNAWLALVIAGCVPARSAVFDPVGREVQRRVGSPVSWAEDDHASAAIAALLAKPLALDGAVRVAFARNRGLQARFEDLGIAAGDVASATVLPPLTVDADYKRAVSGTGSEVEVTVVQDVLDLLQLGQRRGIAKAELRAAQVRAIAATVELAARVEMAFDDALAAQEEIELVQTAFDAASASALLVERQHAAGNTTDLAIAREQEQRERARIEIGRATQVLAERRARLGALLGIADGVSWTLAGRLADPPAQAPDLRDLDSVATTANLDLEALRADADAAAARHRYASVRAVVPALGVGGAVARRDGADWEVGPAIRIGIPLFDQQQGPRARATAQERRARDLEAATRVEVAADAQITRGRVDQAFAEAHQIRDVVMPLRKRVLDETVLQYDAMNASPFELLVARRDMVEIAHQYVEAQRRYWSAIAEVTALRRGGRAMAAKDGTP